MLLGTKESSLSTIHQLFILCVNKHLGYFAKCTKCCAYVQKQNVGMLHQHLALHFTINWCQQNTLM